MWKVDRDDENRPRNILIGIIVILLVVYLRFSGVIPGVLAMLSPPTKLTASGEAPWSYGFMLNNIADVISFLGAVVAMAVSGLWGLLVRSFGALSSPKIAKDAETDTRKFIDDRLKQLIGMINDTLRPITNSVESIDARIDKLESAIAKKAVVRSPKEPARENK